MSKRTLINIHIDTEGMDDNLASGQVAEILRKLADDIARTQSAKKVQEADLWSVKGDVVVGYLDIAEVIDE